MERKRITCPETGRLSEVDLERTRAGLVVVGCNRFCPTTAVECHRECARRMDKRDRLDIDDIDERILIVYADDRDERARLVARVLGTHLGADQLTVDLATPEDAPPPPDYDAIVLGVAARSYRGAYALRRYIERYRTELDAMPAFLFSVGGERSERAATQRLERLVRKTDWHPTGHATFVAPARADRWLEVEAFARRIADGLPMQS